MSAALILPYQVFESDTYVTIKLTGAPHADDSKTFAASFEKDIIKTPRHFIINCENLSELNSQWIRALMQLNLKLKSVNKQLRLIEATGNIIRILKTEGVESSLKNCPSLRAALVELGLATAKALDVNFINPFLNATIVVLETQCSTKAQPGKIYRKDAREKYTGDISGVIGLVTEAFSGSVVISFPAETFLKIISRMLGESYTEINKEIEDGAGELTNIIFGQAKVALNNLGYGIKTAIPSVITGHDHSVLQMTNGPRVVIPFETDVGSFYVEICLN